MSFLYYGDFFDEIIQFAEGLKGYAAGADEFIARIIKLIDDTIAEFEEIVNTIKAFLKLFTDGLPAAGIYWLTIKTYGGNKAIQACFNWFRRCTTRNFKLLCWFYNGIC